LSDLHTLDKLFEIKKISYHDSEEALETYAQLILKLSPTHVFTHKICDRHWKKKRQLANKHKITFLLDKSKRVTNSGAIINILSQEL